MSLDDDCLRELTPLSPRYPDQWVARLELLILETPDGPAKEALRSKVEFKKAINSAIDSLRKPYIDLGFYPNRVSGYCIVTREPVERYKGWSRRELGRFITYSHDAATKIVEARSKK